jgi:hypothetical protein
MLYKWLLIPALFLLVSCLPSQVCRHKVMSHYAIAIEQQVPARIAVYKTGGPFVTGDAHAQVQIQRDGKWRYIQEIFGYLIETDVPEYPQEGFVLYFTVDEFLQMLTDGHYHFKGESQ